MSDEHVLYAMETRARVLMRIGALMGVGEGPAAREWVRTGALPEPRPADAQGPTPLELLELIAAEILSGRAAERADVVAWVEESTDDSAWYFRDGIAEGRHVGASAKGKRWAT